MAWGVVSVAPGASTVVNVNDDVVVGIAALQCCLYEFERIAQETVSRTPTVRRRSSSPPFCRQPALPQQQTRLSRARCVSPAFRRYASTDRPVTPPVPLTSASSDRLVWRSIGSSCAMPTARRSIRTSGGSDPLISHSRRRRVALAPAPLASHAAGWLLRRHPLSVTMAPPSRLPGWQSGR
jgi:hypothetical protein